MFDNIDNHGRLLKVRQCEMQSLKASEFQSKSIRFSMIDLIETNITNLDIFKTISVFLHFEI